MFTFNQFLKGLMIYVVISLIIIYMILPGNMSKMNSFQSFLFILVTPVAFPIMMFEFARGGI